jgi:hypothetical protein
MALLDQNQFYDSSYFHSAIRLSNTDRNDVASKKLLRAAKYFYDHVFEEYFKLKKTRRLVSRHSGSGEKNMPKFLNGIDTLTMLIFNWKPLLTGLGVKYHGLANYLSALISNKPIRVEIEQVLHSTPYLGKPDETDFLQAQYKNRLRHVESLCKETRELLYEKYNKQLL